ncbi:SMI1/KNR4 family protein [Lentzea terrae]|uniref:SMI1/KNR4 family protein n=1 Tax=Lentzea terrae TaxID=2200761 RepID=UPI000DD30872|nr:SMI1/KNR4 family protein [Lentzea terrae]
MGCAEDLAARLGVKGGPVNHYDWAAVESSIGLTLPNDYKALVEIFPEGTFQGFVELIRPGAVNSPPTEYLGYYEYRLEDMRAWRQDEPGRFPYPIFPEPGGLLPWGVSHRDGLLFWLTEGDDPDKWPIVVAHPEFEHWANHEGPVCGFLDDVVSGRFDGAPYDIDLGGEPNFAPTPQAEPAAAPSTPVWVPAGFVDEQPYDASAALAELVPPTAPRRSIDWVTLQQQLGGELPADYRAFMEIYGRGTFCDITVVSPEEIPALIERTYRKAVANPVRPPQLCVPVIPEPDGMIPWGWTADGWTCGWVPLQPDNPDSWGTVLADPDVLGYQLHAGLSFSSLLLKYATAEGAGFALGRTTPWRGAPTFTPLT